MFTLYEKLKGEDKYDPFYSNTDIYILKKIAIVLVGINQPTFSYSSPQLLASNKKPYEYFEIREEHGTVVTTFW